MVHIRRHEGSGVAILEPAGEIDLTLVEAIKNSIAGLVQEGYSRLILDCKGGCRVPYLASGILRERVRRLQVMGGSLCLVRTSPTLSHALGAARSPLSLPIFPDEDSALRSLGPLRAARPRGL
ncbi:MAG: STAS domain-containing protein [candidate division NC10 bacterium]|nr:STAS domain-containing protein [candidate division NC10 bacterium]